MKTPKLSKKEYGMLMQSCGDKFYRMAFCYAKNAHDALEIVSAATYKGLISLEKLREPQYFETWMTRIVINSAIDFLRKQNRYTAFEDNMLPEQADTNENNIAERMDLFAALDRLSSQEKAYIILKYFEDKSFREIAEILAEPEGTVKTRLYKVLGKLRHQLTKEHYYEQ